MLPWVSDIYFSVMWHLSIFCRVEFAYVLEERLLNARNITCDTCHCPHQHPQFVPWGMPSLLCCSSLIHTLTSSSRRYASFLQSKISLAESIDLVATSQHVLEAHCSQQLGRASDLLGALVHPPYDTSSSAGGGARGAGGDGTGRGTTRRSKGYKKIFADVIGQGHC